MSTSNCDLPILSRTTFLNLREVIFEDDEPEYVMGNEHQRKHLQLESKVRVDKQGIHIEREMVLAENTALRNRLHQILRDTYDEQKKYTPSDRSRSCAESGSESHHMWEDLRGLVFNVVQQCNSRVAVVDSRIKDVSDVQQRTWIASKQIGPLTDKIASLKTLIANRELQIIKLRKQVTEISLQIQNRDKSIDLKNSRKELSDQNLMLISKAQRLTALCQSYTQRITILEETITTLEDNHKTEEQLLRSLEMR